MQRAKPTTSIMRATHCLAVDGDGRTCLFILAHQTHHPRLKTGLKRFGFATGHVAKGSCLRTDGWSSYRSVAKAGFEHRAVITGGGEQAVQVFPWVYTFIGNMKRMILGTYHSVSPKHLDRYLAAFTYRANRRWMEAKLFDRPVIAAVDAKPLTFKELTTGAK